MTNNNLVASGAALSDTSSHRTTPNRTTVSTVSDAVSGGKKNIQITMGQKFLTHRNLHQKKTTFLATMQQDAAVILTDAKG